MTARRAIAPTVPVLAPLTTVGRIQAVVTATAIGITGAGEAEEEPPRRWRNPGLRAREPPAVTRESEEIAAMGQPASSSGSQRAAAIIQPTKRSHLLALAIWTQNSAPTNPLLKPNVTKLMRSSRP